MSSPEHPIGPYDIEVAQSFAVEILQHPDHLKCKLDQGWVSIGTGHASPIINAVNRWVISFNVNLFNRLFHDEDSISNEIIDVLGTWVVKSGLAEHYDTVVLGGANQRHHRSFKHATDLLGVDTIGSERKSPFHPLRIHRQCLFQVEVPRSQESHQLVSIEIVLIVSFQ